ncbi:alpha/beta-hydrolase [Microthyrium microscopicum]|uniref:Carboxylic ester hydrolase n=1 Tax=Microthyrium microscopicum TaxID=703497 RepID=A0A6A6UNU2_9PEZI|nr:alpha/beta-hydrolase [Microthyrium microscopicum]
MGQLSYAVAILVALANAAASIEGPIATTAQGKVIGAVLNSKVNVWKGIPFAQSPPERFAPPQDPKSYSTRQATSNSPGCIDQFNYPEPARSNTIDWFFSPLPVESEDCLYLNIYAPRGNSSITKTNDKHTLKPVLFWIHGGGFSAGYAGGPQYNGESLAENHDVVVVAANYRTNVFGFPASSELKLNETNLGFLDQRKALDWTFENIAGFGGDRKKITLFGQSAGAISIKSLISNPPTPLPFRAAILQSQTIGTNGNTASFTKLASLLNCTTASALACVKAAPAFQIKSIIEHNAIPFGPLVDNSTFSFDSRVPITSGTAARIPMIIGTNLDEGSSQAATALSAPNASLADAFGAILPGGPAAAQMLIDSLKPLYNLTVYNTDQKLGSAILTDAAFTCPASLLTQAIQSANYTAYRYFYTASFPAQFPFPDAGAYHGAEIETIFGTYNHSITAMKPLSRTLQSIWAGFAKDPMKEIPGWVKLGDQINEIPSSGVVGKVEANVVDSRCQYINPIIVGMGI